MSLSIKIRAKYLMDTYGGIIKKGTKVLDVGCGSGDMARIIKENTGCKVHGTDIMDFRSWKMPFRLMKDATTLPFKDNEFDVTMLNGVTHHIEFGAHHKLISECLRVSKILLIYDDYPVFRNIFICWLLDKVYRYHMPMPRAYRSPENWEVLFKKSKVRYSRLKVITPIWYPLKHLSYKVYK